MSNEIIEVPTPVIEHDASDGRPLIADDLINTYMTQADILKLYHIAVAGDLTEAKLSAIETCYANLLLSAAIATNNDNAVDAVSAMLDADGLDEPGCYRFYFYQYRDDDTGS